ncbi:MAG: hypothetical protein R3B13_33735 [Polyangiaceae bacterium]
MRNPLEPALTAWKPDDRAQITALRQQGVIAVRYAVKGCNVELEVLPNCTGDGKYTFTPSPFKNQDLIERQSDLFAELPLGAARLAGEVTRNRALRTDYVRVGIAALPSGKAYAATELRGPDCSRATHVVARIYLGGFAMAAGESTQLRAEGSLLGLGGGARTGSSVKTLFVDGVPEACDRAYTRGEESARCSVPLRVGLLPLGGTAQPECQRGFAWDGARCAASASGEPVPSECKGATDRYRDEVVEELENARRLLATEGASATARRTLESEVATRERLLQMCDKYMPPVAPFLPDRPKWLNVRDSWVVAAPGQPTERAKEANALFVDGQWSRATAVLAEVAAGTTGDDLGNRQLAQAHWAIAQCKQDASSDICSHGLISIAEVPVHVGCQEAIAAMRTFSDRRIFSQWLMEYGKRTKDKRLMDAASAARAGYGLSGVERAKRLSKACAASAHREDNMGAFFCSEFDELCKQIRCPSDVRQKK